MTNEQIRFLSKSASQLGIVQLMVILYIDIQAKSVNWTLTIISVILLIVVQIFGVWFLGKTNRSR